MNLRPRYNIAPTQDALTVIEEEDGGHARMMRWGLIPHWAKEPLKASTINARAETITEKPLWREPFRKRRCIIPACGFYKWRKEGNAKQPYRIARADGQPLSFAGLWASNETLGVISCAIIVSSANEEMEPYHDRMPVILEGDGIDQWLAEPAQDLLVPSDLPLRIYAVSKAVSNVSNDSPELIKQLCRASASPSSRWAFKRRPAESTVSLPITLTRTGSRSPAPLAPASEPKSS
jgi:putative SOS response-associated peptidase YedK